MTDLVLTLIGPDRPGLVESLAKRVTAHGGNWVESRMAHLAGQFAGILRVEVPPENVAAASGGAGRAREGRPAGRRRERRPARGRGTCGPWSWSWSARTTRGSSGTSPRSSCATG